MNQNALTHNLVRRPHLFVIAALLAGLALGLGVVLLAQAAPITVLQLQTLILLPDQATNTLPDTTHEFTATVVSFPCQGVSVSFRTDFGQFDGGIQYVEVQTNQFCMAAVTISSNITGTAHIRAWLDANHNDDYDEGEGEVTDAPSTKVWQEAGQLDFGDAPDTYGTVLASNGARHTIVAGCSLGSAVDGEPDGQPSPNADGDDLNALDDEDGVVLLPPILMRGLPAAVLVNGGPLGGMLDAWIDFNDNKSFDHPGEHLFGGTSQALTPGINPPLSFTVPVTATTGITTYARFRLSINGGLTPTGLAPDGEVEDYAVKIQELPEGTGTIVLQKTTDPPVDISFDFLNDLFGIGIPDFTLGGNMTLTIPNVPAATYTITETRSIGWKLAGLGCVSNDLNDTSSWGGNTVTIDLDAGETITCTFNNAQLGTIVLRKRTVPPGGTGFEFTNPFGIGPPGFSINDGATLTIPYVPAGRFSVTEADPVPVGFELIDVECEDPDGGSSVDLDARTATIDLSAGETVTCTFTNTKQVTLTVNRTGTGNGTVTSNPAGINCGADCTETYNGNTVVALTATPAAGSSFAGWSGDCSGTDPTTSVTMNANKTCTATFNKAKLQPVGGYLVPVRRAKLLAPWLGLALLASLAAVTVTLVRWRRG